MDSITPLSSPSDHSVYTDLVSAISSKVTSNGSSPPAVDEVEGPLSSVVEPGMQIDIELQELFAESRAGKIWRTAAHLFGPNVSTQRPVC